MLYICQVLGLLALTIAAPVPGRHQLRDVAVPIWPLSMTPSVAAEARIIGIVIQITLDAAKVWTVSEFRSLT